MDTSSAIAIDTLSVTDKLVLMERLWENLSRRPADLPSPDWHGNVLADRMEAVREGKTSFVAWDDAKKRLQERLQ